MLENTKEHAVVAIPTDKASIGIIIKSSFYARISTQNGLDKVKNDKNIVPHHLYFLSDEDIKEGDWYIDKRESYLGVFQAVSIVSNFIIDGDIDRPKQHCKKVVATTNPDLWERVKTFHQSTIEPESKLKIVKESTGTYKIPTSFIEAFVREQGKIDKVLLEYERDLSISEIYKRVFKLKLKPNGSVIVHPYKEKTYTRTELFNMGWEIIKHFDRIEDTSSLETGFKLLAYEEWFNKHYPQ